MSGTHKKLLEEISALHDKKAADYATDDNRYSNFERSAEISSWFSDPIDKIFTSLIGVKLARIAELTQPGRVANNESLDDSFVDLTNYCAIWTSYRRDQRTQDRTPADKGQAEVVPSNCYPPHKFYAKADRTCAICSAQYNDIVLRNFNNCGFGATL